MPRQPPTLFYLPLLTQIADDDCNPLDHNSPHKDPSAEFVEEAAHAADPSDAMEDDDDDNDEEERISGGTFHDLVGVKSSGLGDLGYSSVDDDEDYDDGMEEEARRIEYSDSNLAGNVGKCVCRLHPSNDRHVCLSLTCQKCRPDTSATFCYVGHFLCYWHRVGETCCRHTFLHVHRNQ